MAIRNELIQELLADKDPQEVFSHDGLLDELKKALAERILNAEMDQHLASERESEGTERATTYRGIPTDCGLCLCITLEAEHPDACRRPRGRSGVRRDDYGVDGARTALCSSGEQN